MIELNDDIVVQLGKFIAEKIEAATVPLRHEIAQLKVAQADLAQWKFCGTWTTGFYRKNNFVVADGSLWIALADTHMRPGEDPRCWQLCTKRGRDGKDATAARAATTHRNCSGVVERRPSS
jgi:hypothetical protein